MPRLCRGGDKAGLELVFGAQDEATSLASNRKAAVVIQGVVVHLVENILDVELDRVLRLVIRHHGIPTGIGSDPVRVEGSGAGRRPAIASALVLHATANLETVGQLVGRPQVESFLRRIAWHLADEVDVAVARGNLANLGVNVG